MREFYVVDINISFIIFKLRNIIEYTDLGCKCIGKPISDVPYNILNKEWRKTTYGYMLISKIGKCRFRTFVN